MSGEISFSLTKDKEKNHTHLTEVKLSNSKDKDSVKCMREGQPLFFKTVTIPRK